MRVHHLSCGSFCPHGRRLVNGTGGLLQRAEIICHCLLIEANEGLVLVDTGFGTEDARNPRRLGQPLRALLQPRPSVAEAAVTQVERLGFAAADVRHVVVTHLDLDHAGGLGDFPAAEVHLLAAELAAALHPKARERPRYRSAHWSHGPRWVEHRAEAGGDRWFGFESARIVPGLDPELLLIPLAGHTRGHTGVAVREGEGWLLHCGDAYFNHDELATPPSAPPFLRLYEPLMAVDDRARRANAERLRELAAAHGDAVTMLCSHDPDELRRSADESAPAA